MPLQTRCTTRIPETTAPDPEMGQKYEESLGLHAGRVFGRLKGKIGTDAKFQSRLAGIAIPRWQPMLNPSFSSQKELKASQIITKHRKKLLNAFKKWQRMVNLAFETVNGEFAQRFKAGVKVGKTTWEEAVETGTLRLTGDKIRGLGAVPIIAAWGVGDERAIGFLREGDLAEGAPYNFVRPGAKASFKSGLVHQLIKSGLLIIMADYDPAEITAQNTILNSYAQGFVDPALGVVAFTPSGPSHLDYLYDAGGFKLELQINRT